MKKTRTSQEKHHFNLGTETWEDSSAGPPKDDLEMQKVMEALSGTEMSFKCNPNIHSVLFVISEIRDSLNVHQAH